MWSRMFKSLHLFHFDVLSYDVIVQFSVFSLCLIFLSSKPEAQIIKPTVPVFYGRSSHTHSKESHIIFVAENCRTVDIFKIC
ncbi:hypothetical protein DAPPUDRAFT_306705 [Daphnia pulex]|uniref:Uncharacterized protein n=1 Tax=Daphnia pulex TaxID=6669 RepID=E9GYD3_DAPPU|nr:hypothetical protein DAPPUDRAFT_306705 [Daphnia pulex]|eukprot:EFX75582.1 hypothetical protein DAPPUDRAFT_306705 [Daphnia pulex]